MKIFLRLIGCFSFFALGVCTLLACFSYHSSDISLNTASTQSAQNVLGLFGAYTSDILLQVFGITGFLIPISFIAIGAMICYNKKHLFARFMLFLCALSMLCWSLGPSFVPANGTWISSKGGGFVGFYLSQWIGNSALFPFYVRLGLYFISATLIILSLNIPFISFSAWFSNKTVTGLSKFRLPKLNLNFKIPTFHLSRKEQTPSLTIEREPVYTTEPIEEKERKPLFSFKREAKEQTHFERKEPTFTEDDTFSFQNQQSPSFHQEEVVSYTPQLVEKPAIKQAERNYTVPTQTDVLQLPASTLLDPIRSNNTPTLSRDVMLKTSKELEEVLAQFSITGKIITAHPGPVVTLYEFQPAAGIKSARIITLADDIAMKMRVVSVRIAVIPGTDAVGIEMPNIKREVVYIREMIEHPQFKNNTGALPLILGKDIGGTPIFADLAKMPHLLVAGTTGSGKSVAINTMVLSLLYRFTPAECRLIMVDPKMVELSVYNRIPHLLTPVVVDPEKVVIALKWAVREMEDRYTAMSHLGVRNIDGYNQKLKQAAQEGRSLTRRVQTGFDPETGRPIYEEQEFDLTPIPYIVIIIDEMADLMGRCGKEVDPLIQRLAQMARAVGIHLVLATQRPSVDVITGTIKSNFPSRISFQVRSKTDSRTILDEQGAERLLGKGDMLFMPAGQRPQRVHGPFVSDKDVEQVVHHWEMQAEPQYLNAVTTDPDAGTSSAGASTGGNVPAGGDLYDQAVAIILRDQKVSTSYVQRQLRIGYNKAADLIDRMEAEGVISKPNVAGKREILVPTVNA